MTDEKARLNYTPVDEAGKKTIDSKLPADEIKPSAEET